MVILFWNTYKNIKINQVLKELIVENNVSIVVLAEYEADINELIKILNDEGIEMHQYFSAGCDRIEVLGNVVNIEPGRQSSHSSIQVIDNNYLLCCVHFNSQIYTGNEEIRELHINRLITDIQNTENELCTDNTIVVGDFNINPYESSCIKASLFHGQPIYEEAKRKMRTVAGQEFKMFYNPMWNFFGDSKQPYGTYYYSGSKANNTYWNIYDQVIIRPSLREQFIDENLKILTETRKQCLLDSKGHPDKNISDHLPIIFEIKENKHE